MKNFLSLKRVILFTVSLISPLWAYDYEFAVCTIFRDNAPYLKEWIEFHLLIGVEHFYLFDNSSIDHPEDVLNDYIDQGIVTWIDWPNLNEKEWGAKMYAWCDTTQKDAMLQGIKLAKGKAKWLALIDADEFIVPVKDENILPMLKRCEKFPGIVMYWDSYGTSGVWDLLPGELLIERLRTKCAPDHKMNKVPKPIVKPEEFSHFKWIPHEVYYIKRQWPYVALKGELRLNHYVNRTLKYFFDHKIRFKEAMENRKVSQTEIESYLKYGTDVDDFIMDKFIPELKTRMGFRD